MAARETRYDELLERSRDLDRAARNVQGEGELLVSEAKLDELIGVYQAWFAEAIALLPDDLEERFREEFRGGLFSPKIRQFLEAPGQPNPLFPDPGEENPLEIPFWVHPYETAFRAPLLEQRQILIEARERVASDDAGARELEIVERLCRRLPQLLVPLGKGRRRDRPALEITDEYDLQDVLHGLLKVLFEDVRPEDYAPERAGGRSRIDFVLKEERICVEAKFARRDHGAREIGGELIEDIERYRSHPDCGALVAVVYDPDREIANPRTLEADLSGRRDGLHVRVTVTR